ncbi:Peptidyl-prolyl cis-trans isomerase FKBP53 [Bienertia sinuspersici]
MEVPPYPVPISGTEYRRRLGVTNDMLDNFFRPKLTVNENHRINLTDPDVDVYRIRLPARMGVTGRKYNLNLYVRKNERHNSINKCINGQWRAFVDREGVAEGDRVVFSWRPSIYRRGLILTIEKGSVKPKKRSRKTAKGIGGKTSTSFRGVELKPAVTYNAGDLDGELSLTQVEEEGGVSWVLRQEKICLTPLKMGLRSEDIDETDSQSSNDDNAYVDDFIDQDEDEFIDDDAVDMFPSSAARKSGVPIEEILDDENNPSEDGGTDHEKKKKKHLAIADKEAEQQIAAKSDDTASFLESEDDDGFPVSRAAKSSSENSEANLTAGIAKEGKKKKKMDEAKDDGGTVKSLKRKVDAINHADEQKSDATETANGHASEDKQKKKKKKKGKKEKDDELADLKQDADAEDKPISKTDKEAKESNAKTAKVRAYPNGLVVENIGMGKPNGKRASRGSKVSIHYIGKLQKSNKHFDSNIGSKPYKFRLGTGKVIKGWDVGLKGMRVGDKRRLTVPPSMGYGASGVPPKIPPNAWLLFDVELVDVA